MSIPWIEGYPADAPARRDYPLLWRPNVATPVKAVLLGGKLYCCLCHYDRTIGHNVPCLGEGRCRYCPDAGIRPEGYLPAFDPLTRRKRVLVMTDSATAGFQRATFQRPDWRGAIVELKRMDGRRNARVGCRIVGEAAVNALPPAFDVRAALERVWGLYASAALVPGEIAPADNPPQGANPGGE